MLKIIRYPFYLENAMSLSLRPVKNIGCFFKV